MTQNRDTNIDLLRIFAFLMVVMSHALEYSQIIYKENACNAASIPALSIYAVASTCIALFVMITGYLSGNKIYESKEITRSSYKSLKRVILEYGVAYVILTICFLFIPFAQDTSYTSSFNHRCLNVLAIIKGFFSFDVYYNWYIEMFISLSIFIPFLKILWEHLSEHNKNVLLIAGALLYALPNAFCDYLTKTIYQIFPYYLSHDFFGIVYCYFIGLKIYDIKNSNYKISNSKLLFVIFGIAISEGVTWSNNTTDGFVNTVPAFASKYSATTIFLAACIFILVASINLSNVKMRSRKTIQIISESTLFAYMLSIVPDLFLTFNVFGDNATTLNQKYIQVGCQFVVSVICSLLVGTFLHSLIKQMLKKQKEFLCFSKIREM